MNLWQEFYIKNQKTIENKGISLHYEKGIDENLKKQYMSFVKQLRKTYVFPVHLNVYIINAEKVSLKNGNLVYGKFCWYPKKSPNIKIPAAINESLLEEYTADEIYESILSSFVHELTHYYQWVKGIEQANAVSERQANFYRYRIIDEYYLQK